MKLFICFLFGHKPRGPVITNPIIYRCERCKEYIRFDQEQGWLRW